MADLVAETGRAWQERCRSAGVVFGVSNEALVSIVTDAARVRQVLDGLLENALRMTPAGAPLVLASSLVGDGLLLEVRDGGPFLAPEDLADAFRPGVLHERYRGVRPSGTGLGWPSPPASSPAWAGRSRPATPPRAVLGSPFAFRSAADAIIHVAFVAPGARPRTRHGLCRSRSAGSGGRLRAGGRPRGWPGRCRRRRRGRGRRP